MKLKENKFRAKIVEKGMTIQQFSKVLGISVPTLYRKLKEENTCFTHLEICSIQKILNLTSDELMDIFFGQ